MILPILLGSLLPVSTCHVPGTTLLSLELIRSCLCAMLSVILVQHDPERRVLHVMHARSYAMRHASCVTHNPFTFPHSRLVLSPHLHLCYGNLWGMIPKVIQHMSPSNEYHLSWKTTGSKQILLRYPRQWPIGRRPTAVSFSPSYHSCSKVPCGPGDRASHNPSTMWQNESRLRQHETSGAPRLIIAIAALGLWNSETSVKNPSVRINLGDMSHSSSSLLLPL